MNARVLSQARDLVLHLQLAALELGYLQVVTGWMQLSFADFLFERLMLFLELRKVRLNGHARFLLMSDALPPTFLWTGRQGEPGFYISGTASRPRPGMCAATIPALYYRHLILAPFPRLSPA